jgi:alcohol dehydrogenase
MRALYYDGAGALEWRDDPSPTIQATTDAPVRPIAVTTCDLDQAVIRGSLPGTQQPYAIGHEGMDEVLEVGSAVAEVAPGDIVVIPYRNSCGRRDPRVRTFPPFCACSPAEGSTLS